ncbi:MAG: hypothetical protein COZ43_13130, partial [Sphingomonadales bacterium CG_4_10_14_3_um_filter_58_15]
MPESNQQILDSATRALRDAQFRRSIGNRSHKLKQTHLFKKLGRAALWTVGVLVGASIVGGILSGIGFWGVMISAGLIAGGIWASMNFPKM